MHLNCKKNNCQDDTDEAFPVKASSFYAIRGPGGRFVRNDQAGRCGYREIYVYCLEDRDYSYISGKLYLRNVPTFSCRYYRKLSEEEF